MWNVEVDPFMQHVNKTDPLHKTRVVCVSLMLWLVSILLVFPYTRKIFIKYFSRNYYKKKNKNEDKNFIDGEYKDMDDEKWLLNTRSYLVI